MQTQTLLEFPCAYSFKVIGLADLAFEGEVLKIMNQHFPDLGEGAFTQNFSKNGKYLAFHIRVNAISKAQLDATYIDLSANPLVLFAL